MKIPFPVAFPVVQSWLGAAVVRVKAVLDPPLAGDARPLEIREAIIDEVEQRTEPSGGGRRVLPYNQVSVTVLAAGKEQRATLAAGLSGLQIAIGHRLAEIKCPAPAGFVVKVHYAKQPGRGWASGQRFAVDFDSKRVADVAEPRRPDIPPLHITIVRGLAEQESYAFTESRVQIGRTKTPRDGSGRVRTNHVAFVEDGDEHSGSVGRAHASICFDQERGEYFLYDEGSRNGTRVVRRDATIDLVRQDPIGVWLLSDDEIQFGTTAVRVHIDRRG